MIAARSTAARKGTISNPLVLCIAIVSLLGLAAGVRMSMPNASKAIEWDLEKPILVEALGNRGGWEFRYAGPDGSLGTDDDFETSRELHLPANAQVTVQLRSPDYIYVFSCPTLSLREIAVPDLEFSITFPTAKATEHDLLMDPMCGFQLQSGERMGNLHVVANDHFLSWVAKIQ